MTVTYETTARWTFDDGIDIRSLHTMPEFEQAVDVEIAVWEINPRDVVPSYVMHATAINGGLILGALEHERMVGMAVALPAVRNGRLLLWSHVTGVLASHQGRDIGFRLKQAQRAWALAHGLDEIRWTFDPLQRGNAHFNMQRLGTVASTYYVDFYGAMNDGINAGLPSDRLEAIWALRRDRQPIPPAAIREAEWLLRYHESGPQFHPALLDVRPRPLLAAIPRTLASLTADERLAWRLALRETLQAAFAAGYTAADLIEREGEAHEQYETLVAYWLEPRPDVA